MEIGFFIAMVIDTVRELGGTEWTRSESIAGVFLVRRNCRSRFPE